MELALNKEWQLWRKIFEPKAESHLSERVPKIQQIKYEARGFTTPEMTPKLEPLMKFNPFFELRVSD